MMSKSHFLKERGLLCLQFIVLLLKDKSKIVATDIRFSVSMLRRWSSSQKIQVVGGWETGYRYIVEGISKRNCSKKIVTYFNKELM